MDKKDAPKDDMKTRLEFIVLENLHVHLKTHNKVGRKNITSKQRKHLRSEYAMTKLCNDIK